MTTHVDLTIIAIALLVMAIMAILVVVILVRVLLHLLVLEQELSEELRAISGDIRDVLRNVRDTSFRVSDTVHKVSSAVRIAAALASVIGSRRWHRDDRRTRTAEAPDPAWWLTGLRWAWSVWSARQARQRGEGPPAAR